MATSTTSTSFLYTHDNYSTASSPVTKTVQTSANPNGSSNRIVYLLLANIDSTNNANVSLDGGNNFITINHGTALELFPAGLYSYQVKDTSSGNHAAMQCLYATES